MDDEEEECIFSIFIFPDIIQQLLRTTTMAVHYHKSRSTLKKKKVLEFVSRLSQHSFSVAIMPARVLIKFSFSKSHQAAISSRKIVRKRNRPRRTSLLPNNTQTTKKKLDIEREETGTNQSDRSHPIKQKEWSEEKNFAVLFFLSLFFLLCICVCLLPSIAPTETKRPRGRWTPAAVPIYWARRNTRPEQVRKGSPHQMGRGEWQNGSLASHARRRQRR